MYSAEQVAWYMEQLLISPDANLRDQANRYLMDFQATSDAWPICRLILQPGNSPNSLFLAAQVLYAKIKADWQSLSDEQRRELADYLLQLTRMDFQNALVIKKVCEALAFVGVLTMNSVWNNFVEDVLVLDTQLALEILECIPFVLDEFCIAMKTQMFIKSYLSQKQNQVFQYLYNIAVSEGPFANKSLSVIRSWKIIKLPIFEHQYFIKWLLDKMTVSSENFQNNCAMLIECLSYTKASYALQNYGLRVFQFLETDVSEAEKINIDCLIQFIINNWQAILTSKLDDIRKNGCDLIVNLYTNFSYYLLENSQQAEALWQILREIILHEDLAIAQLCFDFWFEFRETALKKISDMAQRPWVMNGILSFMDALVVKCQYKSHQQFLQAIKSTSEDGNFLDFRLSADDVFYGIYLIFEKYEQSTNRYLQLIGQLLTPPIDPMKAEIFMSIMRSLLISLEDKPDTIIEQLLYRILNCISQFPEDPLLTKQVLLFFNEAGNALKHLPNYFNQVVNFIFQRGLLQGLNSPLYVDSNAIEALSNLSAECPELFTEQTIGYCLEVSEQVLPVLGVNLVDKLVQAMLTILTQFSVEQLTQGANRILTPIIAQFNSLELNTSLESKQQFAKGIVAWSSSLNALEVVNSKSTYNLMANPLMQSLPIITQGAQLYIESEDLISAIILLYKRIFRAFNTYSVSYNQDEFFPVIAESSLLIFSNKHVQCISVITQALSFIANEPITAQWLNTSFIGAFNTILQFILATQDPDAITHFYDIQIKLLELRPDIATNSNILPKMLELSVLVFSHITNRNSTRSVMGYLHFLYNIPTITSVVQQYTSTLVKGLVENIHKLNANSFANISQTLNTVRKVLPEQYCQGIIDGLETPTYSEVKQQDKLRLLNCFKEAEGEASASLKLFVQLVSNMLRGMGTIDSIFTTEISIAAKQQSQPILIDLTKQHNSQ